MSINPSPSNESLFKRLHEYFKNLAATVADHEFWLEIYHKLQDLNTYRDALRVVWNYVKAHPYQTAFILLGILLIINPLALAGFGALGPVAGRTHPPQ
jgi:hypothetical protein